MIGKAKLEPLGEELLHGKTSGDYDLTELPPNGTTEMTMLVKDIQDTYSHSAQASISD
jgi:hypothetical protein